MEKIINIFDFKHYVLNNLIPSFLNKELVLWRLFGLCIIYCGIIYSIYMEIQFFDGVYSDKILDMYSKVFLSMFLPLFWILGYTPFSMSYGLGYIFSTLLLILYSVITSTYNLVLATNFIIPYFSCIFLGFSLGIFLYNLMSPYWRQYYGTTNK